MSQRECLEYLQRHRDEKVISRDIANFYNIGIGTVHRSLRQLEKLNMVSRQEAMIGSYIYYVYEVKDNVSE